MRLLVTKLSSVCLQKNRNDFTSRLNTENDSVCQFGFILSNLVNGYVFKIAQERKEC